MRLNALLLSVTGLTLFSSVGTSPVAARSAYASAYARSSGQKSALSVSSQSTPGQESRHKESQRKSDGLKDKDSQNVRLSPREKNAIKAKIQQLTKALEEDPNNDINLAIRGEQYGLLGNNYLALKDLNRAIAINNHNAIYYGMRAGINDYFGKEDDALSDASAAILLGKPKASRHRFRCKLYGRKRQYEKAYADAKRAVELEPNNIEGLMLLLSNSVRLTRWSEVFTLCNRVLSMNPIDRVARDVHIARTEGYLNLGQRKQAETEWAKARIFDKQLPIKPP